MTEPTPGGATRAPLLDGEEPEPGPLQRAKQAYDVASDLVSPKGVALLVAVVLIAVTALLGGGDAVRTIEKALPADRPGETVAAAPFNVAVTRAAKATEVPALGLKAEPGTRYLLLALRVVNTSDAPVYRSTLVDALRLDVPGLAKRTSLEPTVLRSVDSLGAVHLQPGLETALTLVYRQSTGQPAPAELTLEWSAHTWRQATLDAGWDWRDPTPAATVTLPVEELR